MAHHVLVCKVDQPMPSRLEYALSLNKAAAFAGRQVDLGNVPVITALELKLMRVKVSSSTLVVF